MIEVVKYDLAKYVVVRRLLLIFIISITYTYLSQEDLSNKSKVVSKVGRLTSAEGRLTVRG